MIPHQLGDILLGTMTYESEPDTDSDSESSENEFIQPIESQSYNDSDIGI